METLIEKQTNTRPPLMPDERPSLSDWAKMFRVSSEYRPFQPPPDRHEFDMDVFKKKLANKNYLSVIQ